MRWRREMAQGLAALSHSIPVARHSAALGSWMTLGLLGPLIEPVTDHVPGLAQPKDVQVVP
jgi:hypothetical protein